jgi:hypothetical protein
MADQAKGVTVTWGGTPVARIDNLSVEIGNETVDVTDLDDSAVARISSGVYDISSISLDVNFEPDAAIDQSLIADLQAGTSREMVITWSDAGSTTWTFDAYCTGFSATGPVKGKLSATYDFEGTDTLEVA